MNLLPKFALLTAMILAPALGIAADITGTGKRFFACDYGKKIMAIVGADGKIEWKREMRGGCHDAWVMPDGKLLWTPSGDKIFEVDTKANTETLIYDSKKHGGVTEGVEIHAFQPHADGTITVFESGPKRAVEIDRSGKILKTVALPIDKGNPHKQMRNARKLANGNYLLALSGDSKIVECDATGKIVWEHPTNGECYSAIRLTNGNTLIGGGFSHRVFEVDPSGKEVWSIGETELPNIKFGYVAQVQRLKNGNTVIINCHGGNENPQIVEVSPSKQVVWSYRDHENFGNDTPVGFVIDDSATR
jgi:outer membrane protein assembly factor BamB